MKAKARRNPKADPLLELVNDVVMLAHETYRGSRESGKQIRRNAAYLGFDVVDELARRIQADWTVSKGDNAVIAEGRLGGEKVLLARPTTMMNLSGRAVNAMMRNRPVELEDVLVVVDDVNLAAGRIRVRPSGSHGGHNGLRSIIQTAGGQGFPRLRVGIRPPDEVRDLIGYVLSRPAPKVRRILEESVPRAADCAECWVAEGPEVAANRFNGAA